ncbi:hypothetical protein [Lysobacter sp. M2-1]|uniref:hypothetical protein n=1 Tax=Lysobacter sp. M2-1 TaxID=2916839 RepID=UPI001F563E7F|nr:hypothetical protein [Lysobacter sp. M2-1]
MTASAVSLDKSVSTEVDESFGAIAIRVVVLNNKVQLLPRPDDQEVLDIEPGEIIEEGGVKRPIDGYLESPKRGKYCCVFLVNGQRQHAWDNTFIIRDLELKYLRNRMIVIVDIDGLLPESIAKLMQGSRHQFYDGEVLHAITRRVIDTLKGDPDLIRLEEEAEQELSSLKSGDEVVKAALDQLIESHHAASPRQAHGHFQAGASTREDAAGGALPQAIHMVVEGIADVGEAAEGPFLAISPDLSTLRLKAGDRRDLRFELKPDTAALEKIQVTTNPLVPELEVAIHKEACAAEVGLTFVEPEDLDEDQFPIHATLKVVAIANGFAEPRIVERPIIITASKGPDERGPKPQPVLLDVPTNLRITSRQPMQMVAGGPDLHVRLRWNGKDELVSDEAAAWRLEAVILSGHDVGQSSFTVPAGGKFELLLRAPEGVAAGERIAGVVNAVGPGTTLTANFEVEVVDPPSPRRIEKKLEGGSQRSPPYKLIYVTKEEWSSPTCWNSAEWSHSDPGAFQAPTMNEPLVLLINQDYSLFAEFREELTARHLAEATILERTTRYTSHVAYHLWQMHTFSVRLQKGKVEETEEGNRFTEDEMREEIRRVASTLLLLTRLT